MGNTADTWPCQWVQVMVQLLTMCHSDSWGLNCGDYESKTDWWIGQDSPFSFLPRPVPFQPILCNILYPLLSSGIAVSVDAMANPSVSRLS